MLSFKLIFSNGLRICIPQLLNKQESVLKIILHNAKWTSRWRQISMHSLTKVSFFFVGGDRCSSVNYYTCITLYSWTIPFCVSSGGGCQLTRIAVPFPSFLDTVTL